MTAYVFGVIVAGIAMTVLVVAALMDSNRTIASGKAPVAIKPTPVKSWGHTALLKEYNSLPAANRPYGDIGPMLAALDVKHGSLTDDLRDRVRSKYGYHTLVNDAMVWNAMNDDNEYRILHFQIVELKRALAEQKQRMVDKAHQDKLDGLKSEFLDLEELNNRMRLEIEAVNAVTEDIK